MADNSYYTPKGLEGQKEDRYVCSLLDSMRECDKTRTYGHLPGLIEQVQEYVNRMEDGLSRSSSAGSKVHKMLSKITEPSSETNLAIEELENRWPRLADKDKKGNRFFDE